jgi:hypothetical protein
MFLKYTLWLKRTYKKTSKKWGSDMMAQDCNLILANYKMKIGTMTVGGQSMKKIHKTPSHPMARHDGSVLL